MRLLDANILMYASFDVFPQHARTKKWRSRSERAAKKAALHTAVTSATAGGWVKPADRPVSHR